MKNHWMHILLAVTLLAALPLVSQNADNGASQPAGGKKLPEKSAAQQIDGQQEGQQVFQQNCERCHTVPENFSPRISGTILRHMRVRAGLSARDEKALLRFLNP